jgi:hypothetical protein
MTTEIKRWFWASQEALRNKTKGLKTKITIEDGDTHIEQGLLATVQVIDNSIESILQVTQLKQGAEIMRRSGNHGLFHDALAALYQVPRVNPTAETTRSVPSPFIPPPDGNITYLKVKGTDGSIEWFSINRNPPKLPKLHLQQAPSASWRIEGSFLLL